MKVICSSCKKVFNIPDDRLSPGRLISFTCPVCQRVIEIDLRDRATQNKTSTQKDNREHLTGTLLKKKILRHIKDLPPMPRPKSNLFLPRPFRGPGSVIWPERSLLILKNPPEAALKSLPWMIPG